MSNARFVPGAVAALFVAYAAAADPTLSLVPAAGSECAQPGEAVVIEVRMSALGGQAAAGFQAFLEFDTSRLSFTSGSYTAVPFGLHIITPIMAVGNDIDLAAGINQPGGQSPSSADATLAILSFTALAEDPLECTTAVTFRPHLPPTRLSDIDGQPILPLTLADAEITVDGTDPVILGVPAGFMLECDAIIPPAPPTLPTDDCDKAAVAVFQGEQFISLGCRGNFDIVRTWTVTDACGNSSVATQTIMLRDTTPPDVSGAPANATVECDAVPSAPLSLPADDNCDPNVTTALYDGEVITPGPCLGEYTITRSWSVADNCGNVGTAVQMLSVEDTTAPVLTMPSDLEIECDESDQPGNTGQATAMDNCDGAPNVKFSDSVAPGACAQEQVITRTWTATDDCGNGTSLDQIISVVDTMAPVLMMPADLVIECDESDLPGNTGQATAMDNCDGAPNVKFSDSVAPGACAQEQVITRTWTATDDCDNSTSLDQVISVVDMTAPLFDQAPGALDVTIQCDQPTGPGNTGTATATDNCSPGGGVDVTFDDVDAPGGGPCPFEHTITRTWTAEDECGNQSQYVQVISVVDTTDPVVTAPANVSVHADAGFCHALLGPGMIGTATAMDNCSDAVDLTIDAVRSDGMSLTDPFPAGQTITITWSAEDECGNVGSDAQLVTVSAFNELIVDIALQPVVDISLTRCITFELIDCDGPSTEIVSDEVAFTGGSALGVSVLVPCGDYECIRASDRLHTLRRTDLDDFAILGTTYVAEFSGTDVLIGGNLNRDTFIDILDFGVFAFQFGQSVAADTNCLTPQPHADSSGDGLVALADFTFIQINFLMADEGPCCVLQGPPQGPVLSIKLSELSRRGLGHLASADLDGNGVLDALDMVAFMNGAVPAAPQVPDVPATGAWVADADGAWFGEATWAGGRVPGPGADVTIEGVLVIAGGDAEARSVRVAAGAALIIDSGILRAGTIEVEAGGVLHVSSGLLVAAELLIGPDGSLSGEGAIEAHVLNQGTIAPGPGGLTIFGNCWHEGLLIADMAATAPGVPPLRVIGHAMLAGALSVATACQNTGPCTVMDAGSVSGVFEQVDALDGGVAPSLQYAAHQVAVVSQ